MPRQSKNKAPTIVTDSAAAAENQINEAPPATEQDESGTRPSSQKPKESTKMARVLVAAKIGGKSYKPNDVIVDSPAAINQAVKDGLVDDHKDAVAYALSLAAK